MAPDQRSPAAASTAEICLCLGRMYRGLSNEQMDEFVSVAAITQHQRIFHGFHRLGEFIDTLDTRHPRPLGLPPRPLRAWWEDRTSGAMFRLQQYLWDHLAGDRARYWHSAGAGAPSPYAPLDEAAREIRVLRVSCTSVDGEGNKTFEADLPHVSLDDDPAYLAVSYAWGDPTTVGHFATKQHAQGSAAGGIGYNKAVLDILTALVPVGSSLHLWIDAVCIDQGDLDERASQVAMMGEIFGQARQVVVFLGDSDEDTTPAMEFVHHAFEMAMRRPDFGVIRPAEAEHILTLGGTIPLESWMAFLRLLSRRWFTRFWVIQEVVMGTGPVLVCGRHAVKWHPIYEVCYWIWVNGNMFTHMWSRAGIPVDTVGPRWESPAQIGNGRRPESVAKFQEWLIFFKKFQATDPRDRIFALLGLVPKSSALGIRPDYKVSVEDLYVRVSRLFLERGGDVMVLGLAGVGFPRRLDLPSWVADWTSPSFGSRNLSKGAALQGRNAAEGSEIHVRFDDSHRDTMWLHGRVVDSIKHLGSTRDPDVEVSEKPWVDEVINLAKTHGPECVDDAGMTSDGFCKTCLWRTLVAGETDTVFSGTQSRAPTERGFDNWLVHLGESGSSSSRELSNSAALEEEDEDEDEDEASEEDAAEEGASEEEASESGLGQQEETKDTMAFYAFFQNATKLYRFFVSTGGHFGLAPPGSQPGDMVCIFGGVRIPYIIRPKEALGRSNEKNHITLDSDRKYLIVGGAYHHGIREGRIKLDVNGLEPICLV